MDDIEKLFRKISPKHRAMLDGIIVALMQKNSPGLRVEKLTDSDFYRIKKGIFRIIFHYAKDKMPVIDSIRLRNEKTYRDF